ncbi:MAG: type transport system ATP-binding protein [Solirubrobacteraceae bacterium]|nr:type transport system ATP-binding protein [Solirubrobacteraceae bacterium]
MTLLAPTAVARAPEADEPRGAISAAPGPPALALLRVSKRWRSGLAPVLDDVSLTLERGTRTWIGGRNGVGKTTLLRVAAGLIEPERGWVGARGITPRENRARYQRLVSLLAAGDRGLYARLSVRAHLDLCVRLAMMPRARLRPGVERAIDTFQLSQLAERRVDRLSMGQRQRLRVAMTFLPEPHVVLLDEPLTSLDTEGAALLAEASREVQVRGGAVLWCSPDGDRLPEGFDARWLLERGRLEAA